MKGDKELWVNKSGLSPQVDSRRPKVEGVEHWGSKMKENVNCEGLDEGIWCLGLGLVRENVVSRWH